MANLKEAYYFEGNKEGCLLIHGFTSTPAELRELGEKLHEEGYTVLGVRLKGHGTTVEDMEKTTYLEWIESAEDGLKTLKGHCDKVYVIGHSMGSILALYLAEYCDVNKVAALSPPFIVKNKKAKWAFFVKYFMRFAEWEGRERPEEEMKYLLGYPKVPVRSVHELNRLTAAVRKELKRIHKPLLVVHSQKDETVDDKSIDLLYNNVESKNKKKVFLKNSGHNITVEAEKERVFEAVIDFIKQLE